MNRTEREHVSRVINFFWGKGTTTPDTVNKKAALVAYDALSQAKICSKSMDLVPRPAYGYLGWSYALKELAKIAKRIAAGDAGIYNTCKQGVGYRYKGKIALALSGA